MRGTRARLVSYRALLAAALAASPAAAAGPHESGRALPVAFASEDGTPLHASLWRAERPSAGLLIVHGMQSHVQWFEISGTPEALADAGVTVLAYDRRGSGRSGGPRGHVPSARAFLEDLDAARSELVGILAEQGAAGAPLHALANCFGTRILLPYLGEHPDAFASAVLTAPATKMSRAADYGAGTKLRILFSGAQARFPTPLEDELFVSSGPFLDWIRADALSLREVTAGFLRATRKITGRMKKAARSLETPMLVVLGSRDAMVVNEAIRSDFVARYRGPIEVVELDSEHYVDFTDQQPALARATIAWVRERSRAEAAP
ncbi:MAG: alpha/beta fold hydrolase [Acidobacteria bacterium]|nr:alpha/beta fold hydrolase [Acidobacteriota bacterium]